MSSAATENNGEVVVEKVAADATAVKEDKQITKPASEETAASDNGTTKPAVTKDQVKGTKRPADEKSAATKKAKKDIAANESDSEDEVIEEEVLEEIDSDIDSGEYDIPYGAEEDDDVSESDEQA